MGRGAGLQARQHREGPGKPRRLLPTSPVPSVAARGAAAGAGPGQDPAPALPLPAGAVLLGSCWFRGSGLSPWVAAAAQGCGCLGPGNWGKLLPPSSSQQALCHRRALPPLRDVQVGPREDAARRRAARVFCSVASVGGYLPCNLRSFLGQHPPAAAFRGCWGAAAAARAAHPNGAATPTLETLQPQPVPPAVPPCPRGPWIRHQSRSWGPWIPKPRVWFHP